MSIRRHVAAILALGQIALAAGSCAAGAAEFIALGDMPYGQDQAKSLAYIGKKIRDGGFPFVVHYGDAKAGDESCNVALLIERRDIIYGLLPGRVFYTPGDNDWTDCDRPEAGGFDETKRLDRLREIFFTDARPPADPVLQVMRQVPDYPENARWEYEGIRFVTLHVVGTDNGRTEINAPDAAAVSKALEAVDARDAANLAWLDAAFGSAADATALVAFMQADPYDVSPGNQTAVACSAGQQTGCNPYRAFLERLTDLAAAFGKPVLLVHGSTNKFCLDAGFGGQHAPNLWRLNGPGDFVTIDAAVIRVDPATAVPFDVHGLLSGDGVPACRSH